MSLVKQNFELWVTPAISEVKPIEVTVTDQNNAIINLTGCTVKFTMEKPLMKMIVLTKTTADAITLTSPTTGVLNISLSMLDLQSVSAGVYNYKVWVTNLLGITSLVSIGEITLLS